MRRMLLLFCALLLLPGRQAAFAQQRGNPAFDATVSTPAHRTGEGPRVLFDEAHHNFHTADNRYAPFVRLMGADGFRVSTNDQPFTRESLRGYDILVISSARGAPPGQPGQGDPAFTDVEADAVREWVHGGGALLLITDHPPAATPPRRIAERFGITVVDAAPRDTIHSWGAPGWLVFSRGHGTLADHPITRGRDVGERIDRVVTFTGNSIRPPPEGVSLLKLAHTAMEGYPRGAVGDTAISAIVPAAGTSQGMALVHGQGRVVVLGEAAAWTSQIFGDDEAAVTGMDEPGFHNRQFILNVMRWLGGTLPAAVPELPAADPDFDPGMEQPTFPNDGPRIVIDAGHENLFFPAGRLRPLVTLLAADGYRPTEHSGRFTRAALDAADVLLIAGPRGASDDCRSVVLWMGRDDCAAAAAAFDASEVAFVEEWVRRGGALLLALDEFPSAAAGRSLARAFGVHVAGGIVLDWMHRAGPAGQWVTFERDSGTVGEHPTTNDVARAAVFGAASLSVPEAASALLMFAPPAIEQLPARVRGDSTVLRHVTNLAGRAAAVAIAHGEGRVVILGDADLLTSQIVEASDAPIGLDGPKPYATRQFVQNLFRWLSGRP